MKHDALSDVFSIIKNSESIGKKECTIPASEMIKGVLKVIQGNKYIGNFEFVEDGRGGSFKVELVGRINDCNSVRPRFSVGKQEFIKWEKKFLPANNIGILILTTSKGIFDQKEASKQGVGGKLLGYIY